MIFDGQASAAAPPALSSTPQPAAPLEAPQPSSGLRLDDDDFTLFGLPRRYTQSRAEIDARWKQLQAQVHPDLFAAQGAASQQVALQWATRVNEACHRLRAPLARASYLCLLAGHDVQARHVAPSVLVQQMVWREALEAARQRDELEQLEQEVQAQATTCELRVAELIDKRQDWPAAAQEVLAWLFIERLLRDLERRLEDAPA